MLHFARWKIILIIVVMLAGAIYAAPNLMTSGQVPGWMPSARMNLGLDLRGGSHLLLEVDLPGAVTERMQGIEQTLRGGLRKERVDFTNLAVAGEAVELTLNNAADAGKIRQLLRDIETGLTAEGTGARLTIRYDEPTLRERRNQIIGQSIEIVRRRVDEFGTTEPSIQQQGQDRILVQVPGLDNPQRLIDLIGKTAKLAFRMVDLSMSPEAARQSGRVPPGSELVTSDAERDPMTGRPVDYLVQRRVLVSGDNLTDSQATFDQSSQPVVSFRFDPVGARRFADATRENVGRPFAIVLDNKVISAPVIREPILGGSGIISGNFTTDSAKDLALLLRAGALPAELKVLEQRTVGPDLGADSIAAGELACLVGYLLIAVLMIARYQIFGVIANVALLANLMLTVAIMSLLHATLTLPGIAGMVLGLAMAVDANVLIYERMREEIRLGRSPLLAADVGSQKAFITILDSNLTTLCAAFFLYMFGSGPVKGFAVTLSIGLICSMFTAVTLTRFLMAMWIKWRKPKTITI